MAAAPEPWLRGTFGELPAVHRAVLHSLQLAREDLERWCAPLTEGELHARPHGVPSVAFHIRHIARSVDRLLTYAEGRALSEPQRAALGAEGSREADSSELFSELRAALDGAERRVRALTGSDLESPRTVGRKGLPTTLGALLVHVADHTQRHVGQAVTTAKLARPSDPA
jgi:uncharacterized damage-inducible protein DinB